MNSILMLIVAVIVLLLVFVMFSLDDREDDLEETPPTTAAASVEAPLPSSPKAVERPAMGGSGSSFPHDAPSVADTRVAEVGEEGDLRFRVLLEDVLPVSTGVAVSQAVVACLQLRFSDDVLGRIEGFNQVLARAEEILQAERAPFPAREYPAGQFSRLWVFTTDEDRDDSLLEAMVDVDDVVNRFRRSLDKDDLLREAKAVIAVGVAKGEVMQVSRGQLGVPGFAGRAVFLAEALAEAARDFQVYVDAEVHRHAQSLFDFREWKPVKLRSPLPALPYFELVGWNKKDEIFAGASSEEVAVRRAVAVAYRYLEFNDLSPLLGLLSDSDEKVALEALKTLIELGDERALGILKRILPEARNTALRSAVIEALGSIGKDEVMPVLLAASKDVNWQVRFSAARALHKICGAETVKHIGHLENDEDGAVRACFHGIMYAHTRDDRHLDILQDLLTDLSQRARKAAVEALIEIGTDRALFAVVSRFREQEADLRRHLLRLLVGCKSPVLYACFLKLFQIADGRSRPDIVTAVRRAQIVS